MLIARVRRVRAYSPGKVVFGYIGFLYSHCFGSFLLVGYIDNNSPTWPWIYLVLGHAASLILLWAALPTEYLRVKRGLNVGDLLVALSLVFWLAIHIYGLLNPHLHGGPSLDSYFPA